VFWGHWVSDLSSLGPFLAFWSLSGECHVPSPLEDGGFIPRGSSLSSPLLLLSYGVWVLVVREYVAEELGSVGFI
jgi:hypothetical protein